MKIAKISVIFMFLLLVSSCYVVLAQTDQQTASIALNSAEQASASAFRALVVAEGSGDNVSDLIVLLNEAGFHLTKAKIAFDLNSYNETVSEANQCYTISGRVEVQANEYQLQFSIHHGSDAAIMLVLSAIVILIVCVSSFLGWRAFKRRYQERSLKMKPEVISNES